MPSSCCVVNCSNRKKKNSTLKFYSIPINPEQRKRWLNAIRRENWSEVEINNARVCSEHFLSGSKSANSLNPDYTPSKFPHSKAVENTFEQRKNRFDRINKRRFASSSLSASISTSPLKENRVKEVDENIDSFLSDNENETEETKLELMAKIKQLKSSLASKKLMLVKCHNNLIKRNSQVQNLEKKVKEQKFCYQNIKRNETKHLFHTGIKRQAFENLLNNPKFKLVCKQLKKADHLLLVLMKLRLGLTNKDLAYRFSISFSVVSNIYRSWLPELSTYLLNNYYSWPEKVALRKTLPKCFMKNYRRCVCIIDCTEIFIQRPLGLNARAQTWSNYKNHITIKYLVACSPTGAITFLSHGWGGRVSDKEITIKSGFLSWIEHGDQILADRGFTVSEEVASVGGILEIPSFTKGKQQLSSKQVDHSRQIANVRIHIERVIGRMRKFNIMNTIIPISQVDLLNHVMVSVGGLVNMCKKIVA